MIVKPKAIPLTSFDNLKLHSQVWHIPKCKAVVALVHGIGEHCGRYYHVAEFLNKHKISMIALDLRGHGISQGKRGHTPNYEAWMKDLSTFLELVKKMYKKTPLFLYGHSLRGNLALNYVLRHQINISGVIASSPELRLSFKLPRWKLHAAEVLNIIWPSLTMNNDLKASDLSHDSVVIKNYLEDPLVHKKISARTFKSFMVAGEWAIKHASELTQDCFVLHGTHDRITSHEASRQFCLKAGNTCTFQTFDKDYHELHNDTHKEEVLKAITTWIEHHL